MTKRPDQRYIGTSHLFNMKTDHEFVNGLDIRMRGDDVEAAITSAIEPGRKVVISARGRDSRMVREFLATMECEAMRARRQAGEFAVPKTRSRRRLESAPVCPECGGLGGNEDGEGNWVECEACR